MFKSKINFKKIYYCNKFLNKNFKLLILNVFINLSRDLSL